MYYIFTEIKAARARRGKEWNEEERRRKKGNFKLEFEKNGTKSITSPNLKSSNIGFKQISPEDRTALNILDGTSPSKGGRRFRPKTKRSPRTRSTNSGDDTLSRRGKVLGGNSLKTTEQTPTTHANISTPISNPTITTTSTTTTSSCKLSPSTYTAQPRPSISRSPCGSPRKINNQKSSIKEPSPEKRLKALSTESLRSVSPGSDSVFYSEADVISDHQVHCHHCGKEVEIVTAVGGSEESIKEIEEERPANIVQPPAGFADSPDNTVRQPHPRLYKKLDKRFRSEERHADRRHFRNRPDTRAKVNSTICPYVCS